MVSLQFTDVSVIASDVWPTIERDYLECLLSGSYTSGSRPPSRRYGRRPLPALGRLAHESLPIFPRMTGSQVDAVCGEAGDTQWHRRAGPSSPAGG